MSEEEEDLFPKTVAFPWVIVAFLVGGIVSFLLIASSVGSACK